MRPSSTYSATVSSGGVSGICGTNAASRASSRRPSARTSRPSTRTSPLQWTSPQSARSAVVLPAPFGPISASHSPASTENETPCSTSAFPNRTETFRSSITGPSSLP